MFDVHRSFHVYTLVLFSGLVDFLENSVFVEITQAHRVPLSKTKKHNPIWISCSFCLQLAVVVCKCAWNGDGCHCHPIFCHTTSKFCLATCEGKAEDWSWYIVFPSSILVTKKKTPPKTGALNNGVWKKMCVSSDPKHQNRPKTPKETAKPNASKVYICIIFISKRNVDGFPEGRRSWSFSFNLRV